MVDINPITKLFDKEMFLGGLDACKYFVMLDGVVVLVHRSSTLTTPQVQFALP
jgi:hypothetical protein